MFARHSKIGSVQAWILFAILQLGAGFALSAEPVAGDSPAPTEGPATAPIALAMPKLSSIQIRIDDEAASGPRFGKIIALREARDKAITAMHSQDLSGGVSGKELAVFGHTANAVLAVCGVGTDYIQYRLAKNSNTNFFLTIASGLFAVGTAGTAVINSAKALGLSSLAMTSYKSSIVENGDVDHSSSDLKKLLEDTRSELATAMFHYNSALLTPLARTQEGRLSQFRQLQAAVMGMHSACAFF